MLAGRGSRDGRYNGVFGFAGRDFSGQTQYGSVYDQDYQVDHVDQIDPAHKVDDIDELAGQNVIGSRFGRPERDRVKFWPARFGQLSRSTVSEMALIAKIVF